MIFDVNSPDYTAALQFLKDYGAPAPITHQQTVGSIIALMPQYAASGGNASEVNQKVIASMWQVQEHEVDTFIMPQYENEVAGWLIEAAKKPGLPMPRIPEFPTFFPPATEAIFSVPGRTISIDARVVLRNPSLGLRILRRKYMVPGDPNEHCPFPKVVELPVDNRVIMLDVLAGNPGWFRGGPADHYPAGTSTSSMA